MKLFYKSQNISLPEFAHIILIVNPQSSNIQRIEARAKELTDLFPRSLIEIIETSPDHAITERLLCKSLNKKTGGILLGIGGGDGTVHLVANTLLTFQDKDALRRIILLPLWGGNANDLACMLNGLPLRIKLRSLFRRAHVIAVHPLEIQMKNSGAKTKIRYGVCYASFGASAYTASQLAKPIVNKKIYGRAGANSLLIEFSRALRAMLDAPGFDMEEDGHRTKIFEQLFSNGSRMAKVDRLPIRLTDKAFYHTTRSDKPPTASYIFWLLNGKKLGGIKQKPVRFILREKAWAQFDGEATTIPAHTIVTVLRSQQPLYMLSTKLTPETDYSTTEATL